MDSNHLPPPYAKTAHILCASPVMDLNEIPPTTGSGISIQLLQGHRAKEANKDRWKNSLLGCRVLCHTAQGQAFNARGYVCAKLYRQRCSAEHLSFSGQRPAAV